MLQCSQKAEIEIVCSLQSDDEAYHGVGCAPAEARPGKGPEHCLRANHPLLVYLSRKITRFVEDYSPL